MEDWKIGNQVWRVSNLPILQSSTIPSLPCDAISLRSTFQYFMIKYILTDIEGTTTDIAFVHQILFPYAAQNLAGFVKISIFPRAGANRVSIKETFFFLFCPVNH